MDGANNLSDLNDLMAFGERLRLLAQLQAAYLDQLRAEGFDEEQAFQLVRDWSNRGFDWTVRWVPPAASLEEQLADVQQVLQPMPEPEHGPAAQGAGEGSEPYLLPYDEPGAEEAA